VLCYNMKVADSIPSGVSGFFTDIKNPFDRTMTLGSTQPLTEISTMNISWGGGGGGGGGGAGGGGGGGGGKGGRCIRLRTLPLSCDVMKSGKT
jgi:uncharacterized membrane protein